MPSPTRRILAATLAQIAFADTMGEGLERRVAAWPGDDLRTLLTLADDEDLLCLTLARLRSSSACTPSLLGEFEARAVQRQRWNELRINQMHELLAGLASAGIAVRTIKGATLGADLYGDALLRESHDVDLVVAPRDAQAAARWLAGKGYRAPVDTEWFADDGFLSTLREASFASLGGVLDVDLHWRIDQPWLPQISPVAPLLGASGRSLIVAGRAVDWFTPLEVAAIQASNILNSWETELRSVVDFARSVVRLTDDDLRRLEQRFVEADSPWVLHVLARVAIQICAIEISPFDRLTPLEHPTDQRRITAVAGTMLEEALGTQSGTSGRERSPLRDNRRFVVGIRRRIQLGMLRMHPGLADYASARPGAGHWSVWGRATARRLRSISGTSPD